ncbi:hypothetical protein EDD85DRAFT_961838 [Armillaria nabsnona]|nr:hypothetical protein EDD85DRAFT_961838 [Armillaria nabsnona]
MSVPVLPSTSSSHSQSQPPLPLPLSNCYHSMQTRTQYRVRNDVTVGGDWPEPTYQPNSHDQILPDRKYYDAADYNRRKVLERGPGVVNDQLEECKGFSVTLLLSSVRDAENKDCCSISERYHPACDLYARSEHSRSANEVETKPARVIPRDDTFHSVLHWVAIRKAASIFTRLLTDFHDDSDAAAIGWRRSSLSLNVCQVQPKNTARRVFESLHRRTIVYKIRAPTQYPDFGTSFLLMATAVLVFRSSVPPSMDNGRETVYLRLTISLSLSEHRNRTVHIHLFTHNSHIFTEGDGVWRKSLKL